MSGWVPFDADGWQDIAAVIPRPWPAAAVDFDLRWWADAERMGRARRPGRSALGQRWGWNDWSTRNALKAEARWGDPAIPPAALQSPSSSPPAHLPKREPKTAANRSAPPASLQPPSSLPPESLPTRVEDTRHTTPTPPGERESAGATPDRTPTGDGQAEEAIAVALLSELRRNPERPPFKPLTPAEQRAIRDVVRDGSTPADVSLVADWVENSGHKDAQFLRERRLGWRAIANDRWPVRLAFAREWDACGRVDAAATGPPARAAPASFIDTLEAYARKHAVTDGYAPPPEDT